LALPAAERCSVLEDELHFSGTIVEHLQARNDIAVELVDDCRIGRSAPIVAEQRHRADFNARIIPNHTADFGSGQMQSDKTEQLKAWSIGIVENKCRRSNYSGVRT
jgi:hypothetical protein